MRALVRSVLQPLRDTWGAPLHVNSGYRRPEVNAAVGGRPTSQHLKGEAADIAAEDPYTLASLARSTPEIWNEVDQMILYPNFVHFSHSLHGAQRHQLLYDETYRGRRL